MNFRNKTEFKIINKKYNKEILNIMESQYFRGNISLIYTRQKNYFKSIKNDGKKAIVFGLYKNKKLAGFANCIINKLYLNGNPENTGYFSGFKIHNNYKNKFINVQKGYKYLFNISKNIKYFYTTILSENIDAVKLLEKTRKNMPKYYYLDDYHVYGLKTTNKIKPNNNYIFEKCKKSDINYLNDFLEKEGSKYNFFPYISKKDLNKEIYPNYKDFYLLKNKQNKILACGTKWNQTEFKQYIVKKYSGIYKLIYYLSFLLKIFGYPKLKKPGKILNFFTISFWLIKNNDNKLFDVFLNFMKKSENKEDYFLIGVSKNNPLNNTLKKKKHVLYKSRIYLVSYNKNIISKYDNSKLIYLECGRL